MKSRTWIEISREALRHNLREFKRIIGPKVLLMSVVKSNAYGHGIIPISKIALLLVDWFGVDSIDEAIALRKAKVKKPILILGYTLNDHLIELIKHNVSQTVYSPDTIKKIGQLSKTKRKKAKLHIKVDTGTSRQGVLLDDLLDLAKLINKYPYLEIEGISTHFANIEDTTDHSYAAKQLKQFRKAVERLEHAHINVPYKHTACSAAAILFPETHFNLARVGIGQYGLWPSRETLVSAQQKKRQMNLKPVLSWRTRLGQIKKIKAGTAISYGCTEKVNEDSTVAILPIGYWDGFDRKLSSVGNVLVNGKRAKVLGRVCMNMTVIDVNHIGGLKSEKEVTLMGRQGREVITAEEMAAKVGTVNYEIVTRINPVLPRIIVK